MAYTTDIHLLHDLDDPTIARTVASAFSLPIDTVRVARYGTPEVNDAWARPETRAVVAREDRRRFGDTGLWPIHLEITVEGDDPEHELDTLRAIGSGLGVPFVGAIADDDQEIFRLVFPDGHSPGRYLDGELALTDDDRRRLAPYEQPARAA